MRLLKRLLPALGRTTPAFDIRMNERLETATEIELLLKGWAQQARDAGDEKVAGAFTDAAHAAFEIGQARWRTIAVQLPGVDVDEDMPTFLVDNDGVNPPTVKEI